MNREGQTVAALTVRDLPGYQKVGLKLDMAFAVADYDCSGL